MARQTKVKQSDKVTPLCEVIEIPAGALPKTITVQLPGVDGSRAKARYRGNPPGLAVGDFVELGRRGNDGIYRIVDADGATVNKSGFGFTIWRVDKTDPSADFDTIAAAITAALDDDVILIGPGTYTENLAVSKRLTLVGFENGLTIITTTTADTTTVAITSGQVSLINLTIKHEATTGTNIIVSTNSQDTFVQYCKLWAFGASTQTTAFFASNSFQLSNTDILLGSATTRRGVWIDGIIIGYIFQGNVDAGASGTDILVDDAFAALTLIGPKIRGNYTVNSGSLIGYYLAQSTGEINQISGGMFLRTDGFIDYDERGSAAATPASNHWRLYFKSDGLYQIDDAGVETLLTTVTTLPADDISFDNSTSGLTATDVQAAIDEIEARPSSPGANLCYQSLTYDIWPGGLVFNDIADDSYVAGIINIVHNGQAPDVEGTGNAGTTYQALRITFDSASSQAGVLHFFDHEFTQTLRDKELSLSLEMVGSGITAMRASIIYWTGTGDSITSDVVGTWATGNQTLASNWAEISAPSADITITSSVDRYLVPNAQGVVLPTSATNMAIFVWTPNQEASTDWVAISALKLEVGAESTEYIPLPKVEEQSRINYFLYAPSIYETASVYLYGFREGANLIRIRISFPRMRIVPALVHNITGWQGTGTPASTEIAGYNIHDGNWITISGALTMSINRASKTDATLLAQAGTSFSASGGNNTVTLFGSAVYVLFDARL